MKIEYVNFGVANNFGDVVEINKRLINHPKLFSKILEHELGHSDAVFSIEDMSTDLKPIKGLTKFMLKNPSTWTQIFPIYFSRKRGFVYDLNHLFIFGLLGALLVLLIEITKLGFKII